MTLSTGDRLDILETVSRADWAATNRDRDAYVALFTEDAVLDGSQGEHRGREVLRQTVIQVWQNEGPASAHLTLNPVVDVVDGDDDRAVVTSMLLIIGAASPVSAVSAWVIVQRVARVGREWLIEHRWVAPIPRSGGLAEDQSGTPQEMSRN
jgi:ketosteroid isomerase-like protein